MNAPKTTTHTATPRICQIQPDHPSLHVLYMHSPKPSINTYHFLLRVSQQPNYYYVPYILPQVPNNNGKTLNSGSSPCSPFVHRPSHCRSTHHRNHRRRGRHWKQEARRPGLPAAASGTAVPQRLPEVPEAANPAVRAFWYYFRKGAKAAVLPSAEAAKQELPMWWVERDVEAAEGSVAGSGFEGDDADCSERA